VNGEIGIYVVAFVWVMTQRAWKDAFRVELDKRMCVTGCGEREERDKLKCAIDMYGVHFNFGMSRLYEGFYHIGCNWNDGGNDFDSVEGENVETVVTKIVTWIRERVSQRTDWLSWQQWLVNELCDKGVVPGRTEQIADKKRLKFMLSKDGSNYSVETHFGDPSNVSYEFVSRSKGSVLIRHTWTTGHHPNVDGLARGIIEDLERAPAIERGERDPIHTGPGSEIVSGAGGGAAVSPGANAAITKLRLYEAVVDLLIRYRGGRISEESVNTVSELLQTLDSV
jgi:hypothetical protein